MMTAPTFTFDLYGISKTEILKSSLQRLAMTLLTRHESSCVV